MLQKQYISYARKTKGSFIQNCMYPPQKSKAGIHISIFNVRRLQNDYGKKTNSSITLVYYLIIK